MSKLLRYPTIFLLFFANLSFAQTKIIPQKLTIDDGLSQGFISGLCQDEDGFLWIGTKNGLNRYDGKNFEVFTHAPKDSLSISTDWVTGIVDQGEFLIITSFSEQLDLFHKRTKRFYHIPLRQNGVKPFNRIQEIYQESATTFWLNAISNNQLLKVALPKQFWKEFPNNDGLVQEVEVNVIIENYSFKGPLDDQRLALAGDKELVIDLTTLAIQEAAPNSPHRKFRPFLQINNQLGISYAPYGFQPTNSLIFHPESLRELPLDFPVNFAFEQLDNQIWLQEKLTNNLYVFDQSTIQTKTRVKKPDALFLLDNINTKINNTLRDRSGILWLGTGGLGLRKISPRKLKIRTDLIGESISDQIFPITPEDLLGHNLGSFAVKDRSTSRNLEAIEREMAKYEVIRYHWLSQGSGSGWLLLGDRGQPKFRALLYRLDQGKLELEQQFTLDGHWATSRLSLIEGQEGQLFLFFTDNCIEYNPLTGQQKRYKINAIDRAEVFFPAQTVNRNIWLGTDQGLVRGIPTANGFDFSLIGTIENGLQNKVCASLLTDPQDPNILWIGTKGGGLHRLDTRTMLFEYITTKEGLPNNVIYGVLNDEEGNLWMSSNKGIIRYHTSTKAIRNFTVEDGLQSNEFNTFAFGKSPDGKLYFGGINGLNSFYPADLKDNPYTPNVKITALEVNNQRAVVGDSTNILKQAIEYTSAITLPYAQNNITLTFAALEFTAPGKNAFSYYLEGAEEPWTHTTSDNRAIYLNLAPGHYTFRIKAANGDGIWSDEVTSLEIDVLPPWYRTTVAYLLYIIFVVGLIWWFMWFQRSKLQLAYKAEVEQQRAERLQELNTFRSRIYTNITHEFRTPLTVILGMAKQLKTILTQPKRLEQKANMIERNGNQLLSLINQILDLSKIENNQLSIHYQQGDILPYIKYITESFSTLANAQNVLLEVKSLTPKVQMDYDAEKFRQILSNLLSNAIKFTPSGGQITITSSQVDQHLQLVIRDTGKGIPEADLLFIFDRFYQVKDQNPIPQMAPGSSGVGLALTKELVKLLDGTIEVQSQLGKGTQFTIKLPIHNTAPLQEQKLEEIKSIPNLPITESASTSSDANLSHLLLIEDNPDVVAFLRSCLAPLYQLSFAYNGAAGIEKAFEVIPDIIISDVMMPEKNGFEVTETLKNDERTSHIPIILLTARADFDSKIDGLKRGADAYLAKPFQEEELLISLQNLLEVRKKLQAKYQQWATSPSDTKTSPAKNAEHRFLTKLNDRIEKHLDNANLKAEDIAKYLGISRTNLYQKLSALTGMTFNQYVRTLRLNQAKTLLETTDLSVSEIAYQVGFASQTYFSTKFTEQFGFSPREFRKR